jgi:hypothetical protein
VPFLLLSPPFSIYFLARQLVNRDDRQLLAHVNGHWLLSCMAVYSLRTFFCYGSNFMPLCPCQVLTLIFGMEYCVGLDKAMKYLRNLAWLRFQPGSSKCVTSALSTAPQAHARQIFVLLFRQKATDKW